MLDSRKQRSDQTSEIDGWMKDSSIVDKDPVGIEMANK